MATQMSKKRKFCADGVFKAELNEMLMRELAEDGCVSASVLFIWRVTCFVRMPFR